MPLPDCSIDAIVTDPPYGLEFMGKEWDHGVPGVVFWNEALRVLKPGGYLLAFGGTRTYHRLTCAIEDAGFEIRDCMMWLYGSGFPKSLDVSKAIDKAAGAERRVTGTKYQGSGNGSVDKIYGDYTATHDGVAITEPATDAAKQWQGWGTALKPAWEPIIVARKPLEKNVAHNVQKYGTGAINIDECRVGLGGERSPSAYRRSTSTAPVNPGSYENEKHGRITNRMTPERYREERPGEQLGRFPANVILSHHPECEQVGFKTVKGDGHWTHKREIGDGNIFGGGGYENKDEGNKLADDNGNETVEDWKCHADCPVRLLDEQSGDLKSGLFLEHHRATGDSQIGTFNIRDRTGELHPTYGDTGGASRFFYTAKASKNERGVGNDHPTVKPQEVMRYLLKLVARPGAIILDPFAGSGTTILVGDRMGYNMIGIDKDEKYPWQAAKRIYDDAPLFNYKGVT